MTTPTANPRFIAALSYFRPSTLAAMAADLANECDDTGDPLADLLLWLTTDALTGNVGEADAERMITTALEAIP